MINESLIVKVLQREKAALQSQLFTPQSLHLLIGVSGGADSIALLHGILRVFSSTQVSVVHVNHGLSPNASKWQSFVQETCQSLNVPCFTETVYIHGQANLEEKARDARLGVYAKKIKQLSLVHGVEPILVLGHHSSDMAEHFLFRLMRAAGPKSLSGAQVYEHHYLGFAVWRPLISVARASVLAYVAEQGLECVHDESNDDLKFSRNYIRHSVLPTLTERWPHAVSAITQSQQWCYESSLLADDLGSLDFNAVQTPLAWNTLVGLNIEALKNLPEYRAKNAVRFWLETYSIHQLRQTLWSGLSSALLQELKPGQQLSIPVDFEKKLYISSAYGALYLYQKFETSSFEPPFQVRGDCLDLQSIAVSISVKTPECCTYPQVLQLTLPAGFPLLTQLPKCSWRLVRTGEKMLCKGKPYAMTFKKLWQEWQIPVPLRQRWPVLVDNQDRVIFVPGVNIYGQSA